jgi:hypothetical protein
MALLWTWGTSRLLKLPQNASSYSLKIASRSQTLGAGAKRIGLLFSTAEVGVNLPVAQTQDIKDIMSKDGKLEMSDGCGLISCNLSRAIAKKLDIHFESKVYVPNVFQLRYRGYKV